MSQEWVRNHYYNINSLDKNLAPSLSNSFLTLDTSKDSILRSMIFHHCMFSMSRAINIL